MVFGVWGFFFLFRAEGYWLCWFYVFVGVKGLGLSWEIWRVYGWRDLGVRGLGVGVLKWKV